MKEYQQKHLYQELKNNVQNFNNNSCNLFLIFPCEKHEKYNESLQRYVKSLEYKQFILTGGLNDLKQKIDKKKPLWKGVFGNSLVTLIELPKQNNLSQELRYFLKQDVLCKSFKDKNFYDS